MAKAYDQMPQSALCAERGKMTKRNPWLWPRDCTITIYDNQDRVIAESRSQRMDLADTVMLNWPYAQRTVKLGFCHSSDERSESVIGDPLWSCDEDESTRLERLIRSDFAADGYGVTLQYLGCNGRDRHWWRARVRARVR